MPPVVVKPAAGAFHFHLPAPSLTRPLNTVTLVGLVPCLFLNGECPRKTASGSS